ncbi:MAG: type II toxin-antitoxin system RelE/ParE family toxin [Azoarcus sp.]|jgi:addiction module RelE/StbE family toxin|nr:type II toxin-antitoxin system RelE/ParE family toxin [Azoarcus sp.]
MRIRFSDEAKTDLQRIGDYIARDDPKRAVSFIDELQQKCLSLAASPRAFPLVPRYERHDVRRRLHGNYLIFYRVGAAEIVILHVLHGAQDYAAILFDDKGTN